VRPIFVLSAVGMIAPEIVKVVNQMTAFYSKGESR
jgi:hypothetical protein